MDTRDIRDPLIAAYKGWDIAYSLSTCDICHEERRCYALTGVIQESWRVAGSYVNLCHRCLGNFYFATTVVTSSSQPRS